jgi:hypothetical protein
MNNQTGNAQALTEWQIRDIWVDNVNTDPNMHDWPEVLAFARALLGAQPPIDMILHCPNCGLQHIDEPEDDDDDYKATVLSGRQTPRWTNPPHRSHLCHDCDHIWRPADVPTNGVKVIQTKGKADSPVAESQAAQPSTLPDKPVPMIYYMRDNHTFRNLPENVETALQYISDELLDGYTSGLLGTAREGAASSLCFSHTIPRSEMMKQAAQWLETEIAARTKDAAGQAVQPLPKQICEHCHYDHATGPLCKKAAQAQHQPVSVDVPSNWRDILISLVEPIKDIDMNQPGSQRRMGWNAALARVADYFGAQHQPVSDELLALQIGLNAAKQIAHERHKAMAGYHKLTEHDQYDADVSLIERAIAALSNKDQSQPAEVPKPVGYMMKHVTGTDIGFAWNENDPLFDKHWKRIPLYTEPAAQSADSKDAERRTLIAQQVSDLKAMIDAEKSKQVKCAPPDLDAIAALAQHNVKEQS